MLLTRHTKGVFWRQNGVYHVCNGSRRLHAPNAGKILDFTQTSEFLAAAGAIPSIPKSSGLPEIIVTGRANVGKSTLLNAIVQRSSNKLMNTSSKAGHTKTLNFFSVGASPGKLILVDAPGYGSRGRPEWGDLFDHYVQSREHLKRAYILFNAKHGLNGHDIRMLSHLSQLLMNERGEQRFTLQAVVTKADTVPVAELQSAIAKIKEDIWKAAPLCLAPIVTSAGMAPPFGIQTLRQNIAGACGLSSN
ncbi:P-loop containing nucleoside triphosphate hydrolase protein [Crepidotus variabilis]|uniref:P-loop containing nucleoside triphosphate hydrolase protein n=1 Tax=Crepidotus variabilis TaxID=179855 RepID=A0A9P6E9N9_9AGAR|nr:P-loop containing nucleoside triphosphate hydrolase protein [Crepidotus variabilis]